jgi:hypothetical protein
MLVLVIVAGLSSVLGGFLVGRWPVALIAPAIWSCYMLGLTQNRWGHGVGDGWRYALIVGATAAAAGAATAVLVRRAVHRGTDQILREVT